MGYVGLGWVGTYASLGVFFEKFAIGRAACVKLERNFKPFPAFMSMAHRILVGDEWPIPASSVGRFVS